MFAVLRPTRAFYYHIFVLLLDHWVLVLGTQVSLFWLLPTDIGASLLGTQEAGLLAKARRSKLFPCCPGSVGSSQARKVQI